MQRFLGLLVLTFSLFFVTSAHAGSYGNTYGKQVTYNPAPLQDTTKIPDLISFGAGYFDFDKQEPRKRSGDMRLEYRWGLSMLSLISPYFKSWDEYVQFHPYAGAEVTTRGTLYASGGWAMDAFIGRHGIFTWSEGIGYYEPGNSQSLHGAAEFRSMFELGYRFDNEMRLTAQISHISDAGMTYHNPGAEIVGAYLHVPVNLFCGH
jgi:hypothetical protein